MAGKCFIDIFIIFLNPGNHPAQADERLKQGKQRVGGVGAFLDDGADPYREDPDAGRRVQVLQSRREELGDFRAIRDVIVGEIGQGVQRGDKPI